MSCARRVLFVRSHDRKTKPHYVLRIGLGTSLSLISRCSLEYCIYNYLRIIRRRDNYFCRPQSVCSAEERKLESRVDVRHRDKIVMNITHLTITLGIRVLKQNKCAASKGVGTVHIVIHIITIMRL